MQELERKVFFNGARVCWPFFCKCRPFGIFERCLDSTPKSCRSKQARYQLSHPISLERKVNPPRKLPFECPWPKWPKNIVSGLTLILEKTHCCKRKILHIAHPGVFLYLDIENSVMGNEISIPTSAILEMSWQFGGSQEIFWKFSRRFPYHNGSIYVTVSPRCSSVRISTPFVFYIIKSYLGSWLRYWEKNS